MPSLQWETEGMAGFGLVVFGVVLILALAAKGRWISRLAQGFCALVAVAAAGAAIGLVYLGSIMKWRSEGPALVFVLFGIPFFGMIAYLFGSLAFSRGGASAAASEAGSLDRPWELFKAPPKK